MPQLSNIPWSQGPSLLPDLFPALSMLSSCYFQSSLWEAKVKICCLRPMWASLIKTSKITLDQKQKCDLISSLSPSRVFWLVAPHPWSKQNPFLFSFNFFILSCYKIDTIENMVCFFSANHLSSGKL